MLSSARGPFFKWPMRFSALVVLAFIVAGCAAGQTSGPAGNPPADARFVVEYTYGGETFFESITIADANLVRRYFNDDGRCRKIGRSPCYMDADLKIARATLSTAELAEFESMVRESGFMGSDPDPDGLTGKSLFYSYNLTVRFGGNSHTVRMGSFPGSTAAPPVARRIYLKLLDIAKKKGVST